MRRLASEGVDILFWADEKGVSRVGPLRKIVVALALLSASVPARAIELPDEAPLPELRPYFPSEPLSASVSALFGRLFNPDAARQQLKAGLRALADGDVDAARAARSELSEGAVEHKLLSWAIATSGNRGVTSDEIAEAMAELQGWPGHHRLQAALERALFREDAKAGVDPATLETPRTLEGKLLLARTRLAGDDPDAARALIAPVWRTENLSPRHESLILDEFGSLLTSEDHRFRTERMLYAKEISAARRIEHLSGLGKLIAAWQAVERNDSKAAQLIEAVPAVQRKAAWTFLKARHLRRKGELQAAAKLILDIPPAETADVDADAWWAERRALSRELLDQGEFDLAYRIAASQHGGKPVTQADAAFHAGWLALRFLNDPARSVPHFRRIAEVASGAITQARAHYWLGRAAEAGAPDLDAQEHYALAAHHPTAFYGQLATARLGNTFLPLTSPSISDRDRAAFAFREPVRAIRLLDELGFGQLATQLSRDLADDLATPEELAMLVEMAEQSGNHYLALRIAKAGATRGLSVGALTHRVGAIPRNAELTGAGEALAYAIARQESEFNVGAVSSAGARGLLQLMPGTAREVAIKAGLPFSPVRLTSDAGYSAALGAAYLDEQLARFEGSYILTFIGYNAGPGRALQWIDRYGDPRGRSIEEVVDWIERIPFAETRNYVQRVMENYQVYKFQLSGSFEIEKDLTHGRRLPGPTGDGNP